MLDEDSHSGSLLSQVFFFGYLLLYLTWREKTVKENIMFVSPSSSKIGSFHSSFSSQSFTEALCSSIVTLWKENEKEKIDDNMSNFKCRQVQKLLENTLAVCILNLDLPLLTSSK